MRHPLARWAASLLGVYLATLLVFYAADASGQAAAPGPAGEAILRGEPHGPPCIDRDGPGPAPCIADPLANPREVVDMAASAQKVGWPLLVLVGAFVLLRILTHWVRWLRVGWRELVIATATASVAAACNAGFMGGTWWAMLTAGGGAAMIALQGNWQTGQDAKSTRAVRADGKVPA
jgi:hypothetical protein